MDEGSVLAIPLNDTKKQHPWRMDGDHSNTVIVPVHTYLSQSKEGRISVGSLNLVIVSTLLDSSSVGRAFGC